MADIKRVSASTEAIESAKNSTFTANSYLMPDGIEVSIKSAGFTSHEVDGVDKKTAVPILTLLWGSEEKVVYLRSFLSTKMDYKGETVDTGGTFNAYIKTLAGKTIGAVIDELNTHTGKKLQVKVFEYRGINRLGDTQTISLNIFNKVGW